ncbi:MAG: hypothetical protein ACTFAL_01045 [Candidatus Electronema sp. V4]|uniref:hypothetical protein n=1 Tax=Candidatus Electronema sp. V4 TaxID=3454756 RepID=UPI0040556195
MISKGCGRKFSICPCIISLDNASPQIYNWTLKVFPQSCRTVNPELENSYDDERFVPG